MRLALKLHLVDTFKSSNDPLLVEKDRDVVGMYLNWPEAVVVVCVDEKTSMTLARRRLVKRVISRLPIMSLWCSSLFCPFGLVRERWAGWMGS